MRRYAARFALLVALALVLLTTLAGPAAAHPILLQTSPAAGYAVAEPPEEITMVFDEPVTVQTLTLRGQARGAVETTPPQSANGGRTVAVRPLQALPDGRYVVRWRLVARDGDIVDGSFGFGVGTAIPQQLEQPDEQTASLWATAVLRWVIFIGLALALGGIVGDHLVTGLQRRSGQRFAAPAAPVAVGTSVAIAGAAGLALLQLVGGDPQAGVALTRLMESAAGLVLVIQLVAFAMTLTLAWAGARRATAIPLLIAIVAEGARSHVGAAVQPWGTLTVTVHLAAAAIWVGGLGHVARTARRGRDVPGQARMLLAAYARLAIVLYGLVVATGTLSAVIMLPAPDALIDTPYGRVLLAKLALVAVATALALASRRHLHGSRPAQGAGAAVGWLVRGEWAVLITVLAATSLLTALTPPRDAAEGLPYPPPVAEPALRLGTLAGQITTGITVSEGHLEVRLATPESDPETRERYQISGSVTGPQGERDILALTPCGQGCFVSPARWRSGASAVELTVAADGWRGGTARFVAPWPLRARTDLLDKVRAVMAKQPALTLSETVTSDTSRPTPAIAANLDMSGAELLEREPYRSGLVSGAIEVGDSGDGTEIAFAIPAEGIYVRLTVADDGRLTRATLTTPNHLITRTFRYPHR